MLQPDLPRRARIDSSQTWQIFAVVINLAPSSDDSRGHLFAAPGCYRVIELSRGAAPEVSRRRSGQHAPKYFRRSGSQLSQQI